MINQFVSEILIISFLFILLLSIPISAQQDTIISIDNNIIVGEVKYMDRGVVTMGTKYSDSDFKIEWNGIEKISTETTHLISGTSGKYFVGKIKSVSAESIVIIAVDGSQVIWDKNRIVYLTSVDQGFWDRLSASIDIGFSITKANNLQQLNTRSSLGYKTKSWTANATFNTILSTQDNIEDTRRTEGALNYRHVLPSNLYGISTISLLSNTEQKLDLRLNGQLGLGYFLVRTNSWYWGLKLGGNRNIERFSNESPDRESWEGYFGTELNLFDFGDIKLATDGMIYYNFTEQGRLRADLELDFKYDLPYNLYIKFGVSFNFDNRPAAGAGDIDYVLQNGIGWEW
jgi:hypothetical protein